MPWEIERRFLVRVSDALWCTLGEGHHYRQGYIGNGESSVRIRVGEPRGAVLTCKIGSGIRREETEVIVPTGIAARLLEAAPLPVAPKSVQILREVTMEKPFINSRLAALSLKDRRKFVEKAYKGV
jgi:CYTH domain-containing protein